MYIIYAYSHPFCIIQSGLHGLHSGHIFSLRMNLLEIVIFGTHFNIIFFRFFVLLNIVLRNMVYKKNRMCIIEFSILFYTQWRSILVYFLRISKILETQTGF